MKQWYLSFNGQQSGPFDHLEARARAAASPNGYVWREGFEQWRPISEVEELQLDDQTLPSNAPPPPTYSRTGRSDEIDYQIVGKEMQYVEVELDPGESVIAEAGAMMYKAPSIEMNTIFGDGSDHQGGIFSKILGAGKRLITGEGLFSTLFTHNGHGKAHVAFAAPYPGNIIAVSLPETGGSIICQKDSFLCAAKGVVIDIYFQRKILTGLFGGEGFIMQKLEGDGMAFIHAGGTVLERSLKPGEVLHVDTGCVVGFEQQVGFDIQQVGGIKSSLFGGEGLFFATLTGPGRIWLQSLPFSRLAGRMLSAAPQMGGSQGEGSVLGGIGDLFDGDNN